MSKRKQKIWGDEAISDKVLAEWVQTGLTPNYRVRDRKGRGPVKRTKSKTKLHVKESLSGGAV